MKDWLKVFLIIGGCLFAGIGIEELRFRSAEKEYDEMKDAIEKTIQELSTVNLNIPFDIGGINEDSTCYALNGYKHQISIEDLMSDARACLEYSNDESLKNKAYKVIKSGEDLDYAILGYLLFAPSCFSKSKKEKCSQIDRRKNEIYLAATNLSKTMNLFYAKRDGNKKNAKLFETSYDGNISPYNHCRVYYRQLDKFKPSKRWFFKENYPDYYKIYWE